MTICVIKYQCDDKCQLALPGPEQPVPRVPQPGEDIAVVVQLAVERRGEDGHVGVRPEHAPHPLGGRDQAEEADPLGARVLRAFTASTAEPPVASIGSSRKKSRASSPEGILK